MKKTIYNIMVLSVLLLCNSCNDWLDILPNNEQVTDNYWKSKEDVEAVVTSGYYYMRQAVPSMLAWSELRGGTLFSNQLSDSYLQNFSMTSERSMCNYATIYKAINMANSVLKYAPSVSTSDDTYYESVMNAHLTEAYFMRAYCYFVLVRNFKEVPLIVDAYVNDEASYDLPKSTEEEIIAQIKDDVKTALATGAAKGNYEETWQTKGRATKWALYALMADVCLWNGDYDESITYCNQILDATDAFRPVFITDPNQWFEIFYPGNSNESIFELNWDNATYGETNNFGSYFTLASTSRYKFTDIAIEKLKAETDLVKTNLGTVDGRYGRMMLSSFVPSSSDKIVNYGAENMFYVWKYKGTDIIDMGNVRPAEDANFILYRVADVKLMKAEALIMKGAASWQAALDILNEIRTRASLPLLAIVPEESDEAEMLEALFYEREMEFIGEGKRWYDLLRYARMGGAKYKEKVIDLIVEANQSTNDQWIRSVLRNDYAWYMPLYETEITTNSLLEQNPYYSTSKQ